MANYRRVYKDLGNGTCVATGNIQDVNNGMVMQRGIGAGTMRQMSIAQAQANGFPVLPFAGSNSGTDGGSIKVAENQIGQPGLVRTEFMEGAGNVRTYRIGFTNGAATGQTAYIGDGNTVAYEANGGTPLSGLCVISGTWGVNSLNIWKLVTANTPVKVDKIRINFDSAAYLTSASLVGYKTRPDAISDTDDYNLSTWVSPDQFQSLIVENPSPLRIVWDATYALAAVLPAGRTVTFTFYYVSVADAHNFRRAGQ